jgi:hypothetical protein
MHKVHRPTTAFVVLICICLSATGCTTTRTLPRPAAGVELQSAGLKAGDKVIVTLTSGQVRSFRLTAIEADALAGKDVRIAFADIEKLQSRKVSGRKVAAIVGATVVVIAGALAIAIHQLEKNSD